MDLDAYENRILLCGTHHTLIDAHRATYPVDRLKELKAKHEKWVRESLEPGEKVDNSRIISFLPRVTSGREFLDCVGGAYAFILENDDPRDRDEMELIRVFLQEAQDYGELWDNLETGQWIEAGFEVGEQLKTLESKGLRVFGRKETKIVRDTKGTMRWPVGILVVVLDTHLGISEAGHLAIGFPAEITL